MNFRMLLSIAMLGALLWSVGFLLPKAIRAHDGLALTSAILTALLTLVLWLWVGVAMRGSRLLSIVMLGAFLWSVGFLLPKAIREHDGLALTSAILAALLTLVLWLWVGVATQSSPSP